jgi:hypothetical protein
MFIPQFASQFPCGLDIASLRALVAAAEQQDDQFAPSHEVDAVAGAEMKAQFTDAFTDGRDVTGIALRQSIDAIGDPGADPYVLYRGVPARKHLRLTYLDHT